MDNNLALNHIAAEIGISLTGADYAERFRALAEQVNLLLTHDFEKLVRILYRMDVSEPKLRQLLIDQSTTDAGELVAALMIEREAEKIRTRERFSRRDDNIDEEDKW